MTVTVNTPADSWPKTRVDGVTVRVSVGVALFTVSPVLVEVDPVKLVSPL